MMLRTELDHGLPPLVWVATFRHGSREVTTKRGALVEVADDWLCEAAWAGKFEAGGLDRTPLVFGSGIRFRDRGVVFVSAGTTVDRLWIWSAVDRDIQCVSNSLVELLRQTGARPVLSHRQYERDLESIVGGLDAYCRVIPVTDGQLEVVYFDNLIWNGRQLARVEKPRVGRQLHSYSDYRGFLSDTARAVADNAASPRRKNPVQLLTSVSSGYDSPAVSVIAGEIGCREGVTISQARSLIPRSDSGRTIGEELGLEMTVCDRDPAIGRSELLYWAAMGKPQDVNLGIFDYPEPVCLFFTGFHGDKVWTTEDHDTTEQIVRGDTTGLGFCEDRLHRGVLHCPLPYWGTRRMDEIARISHSEEMKPWRLHNDYDRPIPRRIVETAGIDREAFGQRKSATSSEWRLFPYTPELRHDFAEFAEGLGGNVTPVELRNFQAGLARSLASVREKLPSIGSHLPRIAPDVPSIHFQWAIDRLVNGN